MNEKFPIPGGEPNPEKQTFEQKRANIEKRILSPEQIQEQFDPPIPFEAYEAQLLVREEFRDLVATKIAKTTDQDALEELHALEENIYFDYCTFREALHTARIELLENLSAKMHQLDREIAQAKLQGDLAKLSQLFRAAEDAHQKMQGLMQESKENRTSYPLN